MKFPTYEEMARDVAEKALDEYEYNGKTLREWVEIIAATDINVGTKDGADCISRQAACEYCHEDSDGYVMPLEKNCHAFIRYGMNGWELSLKAKGWHGSAKIKYCPICGRSLTHE